MELNIYPLHRDIMATSRMKWNTLPWKHPWKNGIPDFEFGFNPQRCKKILHIIIDKQPSATKSHQTNITILIHTGLKTYLKLFFIYHLLHLYKSIKTTRKDQSSNKVANTSENCVLEKVIMFNIIRLWLHMAACKINVSSGYYFRTISDNTSIIFQKLGFNTTALQEKYELMQVMIFHIHTSHVLFTDSYTDLNQCNQFGKSYGKRSSTKTWYLLQFFLLTTL